VLPVHVVSHCRSALNVLRVRAHEGAHKGVHPRHSQRKAHAVKAALAGCIANCRDIRGGNGLLHKWNGNQNIRACPSPQFCPAEKSTLRAAAWQASLLTVAAMFNLFRLWCGAVIRFSCAPQPDVRKSRAPPTTRCVETQAPEANTGGI